MLLSSLFKLVKRPPSSIATDSLWGKEKYWKQKASEALKRIACASTATIQLLLDDLYRLRGKRIIKSPKCPFSTSLSVLQSSSERNKERGFGRNFAPCSSMSILLTASFSNTSFLLFKWTNGPRIKERKPVERKEKEIEDCIWKRERENQRRRESSIKSNESRRVYSTEKHLFDDHLIWTLDSGGKKPRLMTSTKNNTTRKRRSKWEVVAWKYHLLLSLSLTSFQDIPWRQRETKILTWIKRLPERFLDKIPLPPPWLSMCMFFVASFMSLAFLFRAEEEMQWRRGWRRNH